MTKYNETGMEDVTGSWDRIEEEFKCCGVLTRTDWTNSTYGRVPDSCCVRRPVSHNFICCILLFKKTKLFIEVVVGCGEDSSEEKYGPGCLSLLKEEFLSNMSLIGGLAIGIAFLHAVGVLLACCVGNMIRTG